MPSSQLVFLHAQNEVKGFLYIRVRGGQLNCYLKNLFRCTASASAPASGIICAATGKLGCNLCEGQVMLIKNCKISEGGLCSVLYNRVSLLNALHAAGGTCTTA